MPTARSAGRIARLGWAAVRIGVGVAESWPIAGTAQGHLDRWWIRSLLLGCVPVASALGVGVMTWLLVYVAERDAVTFVEALTGVPLALAAALGGDLAGAFANIDTAGAWAIPFTVAVMSGLLTARWWRSSHLGSYVLAGAVTLVVHSAAALALGATEVYDPTSFSTASVLWVPASSVVTSGLAWLTTWATRERDLGRHLAVTVVATFITGAIVAVAAAVHVGVRAAVLLPVAWLGGLFGLNAVSFSLVWLAGAGAGITGGPTSQALSWSSVTASYGWSLWLLPVTGALLLIVAGTLSRGVGSPAAAVRRLRDLALTATLALPLVTAMASPRRQDVSRGEAEQYLGVTWDSLPSFIGPVGAVLLLLAGSMSVAALQRREPWPRATVDATVRWLKAPTGPRLTPAQVANRPATPSWPPTSGMDAPAPRPLRAMADVDTPTPAPTATVPTTHPFEDTSSPPLNPSWSAAQPAEGDPSTVRAPSVPTPPSAPPAIRNDAEIWRTAPPPVLPDDEQGGTW